MNKQDKLNVFIRIGRLFMILASVVLITMAVVYLYVDKATYSLIVLVLMIAVSAIMVLAGLLLMIILSSYQKNKMNRMLAVAINIFLRTIMPIAIELGKLLSIEKSVMRSFFVDLNNLIVRSLDPKCTAEHILILVPHCLQWSKCRHKITNDPSNCKRCGKCKIGGLLELTQDYGIKMMVASGGTMARKAIMENKPKVIISVACSRDLASGIMDVEKVPVIAIENITPEGPCINTQVDLEKVEQAIQQILSV